MIPMIDDYPFSGPDFEIGKLYIDRVQSLISVRISDTHGIRVRPREMKTISVGSFHYQYRECSLTELSSDELSFYQQHVLSLIQGPKVCICPIDTLMLSGCKCGGK